MWRRWTCRGWLLEGLVWSLRLLHRLDVERGVRTAQRLREFNAGHVHLFAIIRSARAISGLQRGRRHVHRFLQLGSVGGVGEREGHLVRRNECTQVVKLVALHAAPLPIEALGHKAVGHAAISLDARKGDVIGLSIAETHEERAHRLALLTQQRLCLA